MEGLEGGGWELAIGDGTWNFQVSVSPVQLEGG